MDWVRWLCLASWLCVSACGLDVVEFTVTQTGQVGMASLQFPGMEQFGGTLLRALSDRSVSPDDVDSMKVTSMVLAITADGGLTRDLTFLHGLMFTVQANAMPATRLAGQDEFSAGTRRASLPLTPDMELKPYLEAGGMALGASASLDPLPPDRVDLQLDISLRVDVNAI